MISIAYGGCFLVADANIDEVDVENSRYEWGVRPSRCS